jgi:hypothetical protein
MNEDQIPDAISHELLAQLIQGPTLPPAPNLPALHFARQRNGDGGSDLNVAILALIERAENTPSPFQVLTAALGLLASLAPAPIEDLFSDERLAEVQKHLPRGTPLPSKEMRARIRNTLAAQVELLSYVVRLLDGLHTEWMAGILGNVMATSDDPETELARFRSGYGLVSDEMLAGLGYTREQFNLFAAQATAFAQDSDPG